MSVAEKLLQTYSEKKSNAMKADRAIKRIMFKNPEALSLLRKLFRSRPVPVRQGKQKCCSLCDRPT